MLIFELVKLHLKPFLKLLNMDFLLYLSSCDAKREPLKFLLYIFPNQWDTVSDIRLKNELTGSSTAAITRNIFLAIKRNTFYFFEKYMLIVWK